VTDSPQFLVEWSSPWREFVSAIRPAIRRSPPRLRHEARAGLFPARGLVVALLLEAAAVAAAIAHPYDRMKLVVLEKSRPSHDVIYFSPDELPRTRDLGGASSGNAGRSGGASMRTRKQVIRVARDSAVREKVLDAPQLNLPKSESLPANLLAYKAEAGPAPAAVLALRRKLEPLPIAVAPPLPEIRTRELRLTQLANAAVVPPPAELPHQDILKSSFHNPTAVVPPPVPPPVSAPTQATSNPARLTFPAQAVIAPPPELNARRSRTQSNELAERVVPPPVEVSAVRTTTHGLPLNGSQVVVPPPVELEKTHEHTVRTLGEATVSAPAVNIAGLRQSRSIKAANVGASPPAASTLSQAVGNSSTKGATGKDAVPSSTGVVVSSTPGDKPKQPANSEKASLAFSPRASQTQGAGTDGGGSGVASGSGPGSSSSGSKTGSDLIASSAAPAKSSGTANIAATSPYPGPGGAGNLSHGNTRVPGVSVSGGSNVVTLPSFGAAPSPGATGRSNVPRSGSNTVTVVASPRAGGAMNLYGAMKGDRVYSIYISTSIGQASMQFADPASAVRPYADELTAPTPIRADLPTDLPHQKLVVRYVLDRNGTLQNPQVLNSESNDFESKLLAALANWKFTPALRGKETIEVNVILGFGVDTN
jgi:hypothetical protein